MYDLWEIQRSVANEFINKPYGYRLLALAKTLPYTLISTVETENNRPRGTFGKMCDFFSEKTTT